MNDNLNVIYSYWNDVKNKFNEYLEVIKEGGYKQKDGYLELIKCYDGWARKEVVWKITHSGYNNQFSVEARKLQDVTAKAIYELDKLIIKETIWDDKERLEEILNDYFRLKEKEYTDEEN